MWIWEFVKDSNEYLVNEKGEILTSFNEAEGEVFKFDTFEYNDVTDTLWTVYSHLERTDSIHINDDYFSGLENIELWKCPFYKEKTYTLKHQFVPNIGMARSESLYCYGLKTIRKLVDYRVE